MANLVTVATRCAKNAPPFVDRGFSGMASMRVRGLAERPTVVWNHRFPVPAYIMAGKKDEAQRRFAESLLPFPV